MKYYVVFVGRKSGVYETWRDCEDNVKGFRGAQFKSFPSKDEAEMELKKFQRRGHEQGEVKTNYGRPTIGICSDAAYSSKTNIVSYRVVNIENDVEIIRADFKGFTSKYLTNIGEFFGLVRAVKYVNDRKLELPIYCDSKTAIEWVENRDVKTGIQEAEILRLVNGGLMYLRSLNKIPPVFKWQTDKWGEIPADFGNKKGSKKVKK